ncbi:MAG: hypothetical protein LUQ09_03590 [Methanomassiliicoccales archaeon]|nr:hypothetical protein [Methanomassiliicoccales archaeon]
MDLFGGKRTDKAQESKRIKDIQQLIRDVAGDVDEERVDVTEVHEMMKAKQAQQTAETKEVQAAPAPTPRTQPAIEPRKIEPAPGKESVTDATRTSKVPEESGLKLPPKGYVESVPEEKRNEPVPPVKLGTAPELKKVEPTLDVKKVEPEKRRSYEPVFCIHCGTRLAEDGSGCPKCPVKRGSAGPPVSMPPRPSPVPQQQPRTVPMAPAPQRPVFCIYCGTRLPQDGSGCAKCFSQRWRRCQSCGAWVRATDISCPVCHRVLSIEPGRNDDRYMRR